MSFAETRDERPVSEEMLSGYLDGVLVQQDEQRTRLYLERSPEARRLLEELRAMRAAARGTRFVPPDDRQWSERPRSRLSGVLRGGGWLLLVLWLLGFGTYAVVEFVRSPESLTEKLLAVGGVSAFALLFLSVAMDRWKAAASDRYGGVEK